MVSRQAHVTTVTRQSGDASCRHTSCTLAFCARTSSHTCTHKRARARARWRSLARGSASSRVRDRSLTTSIVCDSTNFIRPLASDDRLPDRRSERPRRPVVFLRRLPASSFQLLSSRTSVVAVDVSMTPRCDSSHAVTASAAAAACVWNAVLLFIRDFVRCTNCCTRNS